MYCNGEQLVKNAKLKYSHFRFKVMAGTHDISGGQNQARWVKKNFVFLIFAVYFYKYFSVKELN